MRIIYLFAVLLGFWMSFQLGALWTQAEVNAGSAPQFPPRSESPYAVDPNTRPPHIADRGSEPQARVTQPQGSALDPVPKAAMPANKAAVATVKTAPMVRERQNLVLGLAINQESTKYVRRFIVSLRRAAPDAVLVLCVDSGTRAKLAALEVEYDVTFFVFDPAALPQPWAKYHPSNYRYWVYEQWLAGFPADELATAFRAAFVTDVRDAVFQSDPFAAIMDDSDGGESLHVFEEVLGRQIAHCGWNSGWISDCYHPKLFERMRTELILCSGTTMGSWGAVLRYINAMFVTLLESSFCERNGIDQGAHNVLLRTAAGSLADQVTFHSHEHGRIATLGMVGTEAVVDAWRDGVLFNKDNVPYAVVHQVDRHNFLDQALSAKFS